MTEPDVAAEVREWLTGMAARYRDHGLPLPTAVLCAHWPIREYGMRCQPPSALPGGPLALAQVKPPDVTFYAVLDDDSEIAVAVSAIELQAAR